MRAVAALVLVAALAAPCPAAPPAFRFSPRPNRAREIHWRAWSPDAFAAARRAHQPLLLSLSAIWCHWCHVMDETTFSDPAVIARLNRGFVPVRVDADQHPDVERRYLLGGWPTVAFLTPDGEIIGGGSYMPPADFLALADDAAAAFAAGGATLEGHLVRYRFGRDEATPGALPPTLVEDTVRALGEAADPRHGGFGGAPKFPEAAPVALLLAVGEHDLARRALDAMLALEDPVAGGFFRYATQADWSRPHYEKLLSTNADLLALYARASVVLHQPRYAAVARRTAAWVRTTLFDPKTGALWASQDADERYYGLDAAARARVPAPFVDKTLLADRACRMISALADAGRDLGDPSLRRFAAAAARALPDPLVHAPGVPAELGDYAECALAAAALDDRPRARRLLAAAAPLAAPDGGYFDAPPAPLLRRRTRPLAENARLALAFARVGDAAAARAIARAFARPTPDIALVLVTIGR